MAVVDLVKWNGGPEVYAWKFPSEELSTWTQLIVSESQEAMLLKEGKMVGPFGPGRHVLSTANFPLISSVFKLPFGGKSPFTAEVWFVNRMQTLDVKWGTPDPIQLADPRYNVMVPVRGFGQYGVQISDSRKFLTKFVGTMAGFDRNQLTSYFRGLILTRAKDAIASQIIEKKLSVLEIAAHLNEISSGLQDEMTRELEEFGVKLVNFFINSINIPEDDPAVARLKEALARKAEMDIIGFTYQQEKSFETMKAAAENPGGGQGGLMGAGIGLGMGLGMGGTMGNAMGQMAQNINPGGGAPAPSGGAKCGKCGTVNLAGARFCSGCGQDLTAAGAPGGDLDCDKCGKPVSPGAKFCPNCGDPISPCPKCGADNSETAVVCRRCGGALPRRCPGCGHLIQGGGKFCPECGKPLVKRCGKCNHELEPGIKFCPECGAPTGEPRT